MTDWQDGAAEVRGLPGYRQGRDDHTGAAYYAHASGEGMIVVSEDQPSSSTPDTPGSSGVNPSRQGLGLADATRVTGTVVSRLTEQARSTANAAKAGRLMNDAGEPGVLDVTPVRELLAELVQELQRLQLREQIGWALRQAAEIIDPQTPGN